MKFRKKPVIIEAHRWYKNGDHPDDNCRVICRSGEDTNFLSEGKVVRYYRTPDMDGKFRCSKCNQIMHKHGWIDTLEGNHIVCPGDWIITGVAGERYPCKPEIFKATYEPVTDEAHTETSKGFLKKNPRIIFEPPPKLTTRSPLRYPGGKSRAVSAILPHIPENTKKVCSPFFGGGSVELALMGKGIRVFGSDIFSPLVDFWQEAIENPVELSKRVRKYFPLPRTKFYSLQKRYNELPDKLERAAVFFVLNRCSFSGTTFSGGMSPGHPRFTQSAIERLKNFRSAGLKVRKMDYKDALWENPYMVTYLDPPYLIETNNLYGSKGKAHKGFNHEELASILRKRDKWVLSYNDCPKIRELYKHARILESKWKYGMSNGKKSKELLIISPGSQRTTMEK